MADQPQAAPGTAGLYALYQAEHDLLEQERLRRSIQGERIRAMILCWADEYERELGYGEGERPPRTAQIRQWWRQAGQPSPKGNNARP